MESFIRGELMNSLVYAVMAPVIDGFFISGEKLQQLFKAKVDAEAFAIGFSASRRSQYSQCEIAEIEEYKSMDAFVVEYPLN